MRGDDEMVDVGDLKSPGRKAVRVRVPLAPPAHLLTQIRGMSLRNPLAVTALSPGCTQQINNTPTITDMLCFFQCHGLSMYCTGYHFRHRPVLLLLFSLRAIVTYPPPPTDRTSTRITRTAPIYP
jgi:hypothetical protein